MSGWVRRWHRRIGVLFLATVALNFAAFSFSKPPAVITYAPLLPLGLMALSGIYLFVLPYTRKRKEQVR